ncbi:MAG: response regulator transcription factor [Anaerolineae bacterium]
MFLLPPFLKQFLRKRKNKKKPRIYLKDEQLVVRVKTIAVDQRRAEQEVYDDIVRAGVKVFQAKDHYARIWDLLSERERQVTALTCLGYRSYEIAEMLGISYDTVRTHSKHIYAKFGLTREDLRVALQDWDFQTWFRGQGL